jgi:hypothetical protein
MNSHGSKTKKFRELFRFREQVILFPVLFRLVRVGDFVTKQKAGSR